MDENRMARIETKLDDIHKNIGKVEAELTGLSRDLNHLGHGMRTTRQDVDNLKQEIDALKLDVRTTHAKLKTVYAVAIFFGGSIVWILRETGVLARVFRTYYTGG